MNDQSPQARRSVPTPAHDGAARPGPIARLSIDQKLPAIIGGLLLAVIIALSVASYVEVRGTSLRIATDRLESLTRQYRDLFQPSVPGFRNQMATAASREGVVAFVAAKNPTKRMRDSALADLKFIPTNPQQVIATELRDAQGRVLLSTAPGIGVDTMAVADVLPRTEPGDSAAVGVFRMLRDTIVYPTAKLVKGSDDTYVVRWRRLVMTPQTRDGISRLVGTYATPYLGSPSSKVWIDYTSTVAPPPLDPTAPGIVQEYQRNGEPYLAGAAMIVGTPWMVSMDIPMTKVMAPVSAFMREFLAIAVAALLVALVAGRVLSRQLTKPLVELTEAAGHIAGGDFSREVNIKRADELGRLGKAFAAMASEVKFTRDNLENKVSERTRELNDTLTKLSDAQDTLVRRERLAMLGQLSSGVGHELRNPLGVMTNSVYYLKMVLAEQPPNVHEYLGIISQQITLSEKIVSDLLDFARQKPPQRAPTSLVEVSNLQLSRLGATDGVEIKSTINGQLPPVLVDHVQLGQIILNLLTNAVQAVGKTGQVVIKARGQGDVVHYEVADTGPGVPPENIEKVFEPLFTTKARGIGLGLAVSRTLARANGGDLTLAKGEHAGAVFRLTLPIAAGNGASAGGAA
jgi:signal transduction histidine kinase